MKRIIKFIVHHILAISPELGIRVKWFHFFKEQINLKQPKLLEEKVNWLKLHELPYKEIYTQCADKYLVREYVKANSLGYLLNDLVRVYDRAEDIKLDELPDSFAMKWNFGNGMNFICPDKSKVNEVSLIRKFKQWGGAMPISSLLSHNIAT